MVQKAAKRSANNGEWSWQEWSQWGSTLMAVFVRCPPVKKQARSRSQTWARFLSGWSWRSAPARPPLAHRWASSTAQLRTRWYCSTHEVASSKLKLGMRLEEAQRRRGSLRFAARERWESRLARLERGATASEGPCSMARSFFGAIAR